MKTVEIKRNGNIDLNKYNITICTKNLELLVFNELIRCMNDELLKILNVFNKNHNNKKK